MNRSHQNIRLLMVFIFAYLINPSLFAQVDTLIDENTSIRVLIPDAVVKSNWRSNLTFDDSQWIQGKGGVGFGTNYTPWINVSVGDKMYQPTGSPASSCMIRIKFQVTQEHLAKAKRLMLSLKYDDGCEIYLNGTKVLSKNVPSSPKYNSLATGVHNADSIPEITHLTYNVKYEVYNSAINLLRAGDNLLTVQGFNISPDDPDFLLSVKLTLEMFGTPPVFESSNLPIIVINTNGGVILDTSRIKADMGIISNGTGQRNNLSDPFNGYNGNISIETHGSSSTSYPKKSYNIETEDASGKNNNVSLLGLPEENDWILYNTFTDKTLIRDVLMYRLSNLMGRYASRSRYCELVLNGEYRGVYVLLEKVKRDMNRVDISKLDNDDNKGDSLTGGYIIKLDQPDPDNEYFTSAYPPYKKGWQKIQYIYTYPKKGDITAEQKQYIQQFTNKFEIIMNGDKYADPDSGYSKYIDEDSFVDHFLLNEICKNVDGYRLSSYFYKEKDSKGGKLFAGPIWDMNLSLGNAGYYGSDSTKCWEIDELSLGSLIRSDLNLPPSWWETLIHEPGFANRISQRWHSLRSGVMASSKIYALIDAIADTLQEAQERNFKIFSGPGDAGTGFWVTPNVFYTFYSYQDEINYLKQWINERMEWMDDNISGLTDVSEKPFDKMPKNFSLMQNFPNPFNPSTDIIYSIPSSGTVQLSVFNILGQKLSSLINNESQSAGRYKIHFNGNYLSSGIYFYTLQFVDIKGIKQIQTKKMLLIK